MDSIEELGNISCLASFLFCYDEKRSGFMIKFLEKQLIPIVARCPFRDMKQCGKHN